MAKNNNYANRLRSDSTNSDNGIIELRKVGEKCEFWKKPLCTINSTQTNPDEKYNPFILPDDPSYNKELCQFLYDGLINYVKNEHKGDLVVSVGDEDELYRHNVWRRDGGINKPVLVCISAGCSYGLRWLLKNKLSILNQYKCYNYLLVPKVEYKQYLSALQKECGYDAIHGENSYCLGAWEHKGGIVGFGVSRRAGLLLGAILKQKRVIMADDTVIYNEAVPNHNVNKGFNSVLDLHTRYSNSAVGVWGCMSSGVKVKIPQGGSCEEQLVNLQNLLKLNDLEAKKDLEVRPIEQLVSVGLERRHKSGMIFGKEDMLLELEWVEYDKVRSSENELALDLAPSKFKSKERVYKLEGGKPLEKMPYYRMVQDSGMDLYKSVLAYLRRMSKDEAFELYLKLGEKFWDGKMKPDSNPEQLTLLQAVKVGLFNDMNANVESNMLTLSHGIGMAIIQLVYKSKKKLDLIRKGDYGK